MTDKIEFRNRQKRKAYAEWIESSDIFLHLDARKDGVEVQKDLSKNPMLTLKLSYSFTTRPEHDENGVIALLKFSGNYERCVIPWSAVWGVSSSTGEQKLWREDLPPEAAVAFAKEAFKNFKGRLMKKVTKASKTDTDKLNKNPEDHPKNQPKKPTTRKKPNLRRVK